MPDLAYPRSVRQLTRHLSAYPRLLMVGSESAYEVTFRGTFSRRNPPCLRMRLAHVIGDGKLNRPLAGHEGGDEVGLRFGKYGFTVNWTPMPGGDEMKVRYEYLR